MGSFDLFKCIAAWKVPAFPPPKAAKGLCVAARLFALFCTDTLEEDGVVHGGGGLFESLSSAAVVSS